MDWTHWTAGVHHDSSALYVSNPLPKAGERITIHLRTPLEAPIKGVFLRTAPDGENHFQAMHIVERDAVCAYWEAPLHATMPCNPYRFKILTDEGAYYYTALGVSRADKPDWFDFKLLAGYAAPTWVYHAVFYQIFPDRFFNGRPDKPLPNFHKRQFTAQQRAWGEPPLHWAEGGNLDFYGGDLQGITQKLDYLRDLGVTALYLNPIFGSHSNHRYDIHDFFHVDPYLGGDEALIELREALDRAGMRLMLDVTPNHLSWQHPWFTAAQTDKNAPTSEFFTFYDEARQDYESWLGHKSLVKINYQSPNAREIMYRAPDSVLRHWLADPYRIDGWRLDVWNMTGRQGWSQLGHEVGREIRAAVKAQNPQAYLIGEHFFDGTPYLQGDELDATMNYQGFAIPLRRWLAGFDLGADFRQRSQAHVDRSRLPTEAFAEQLQTYLAAVPYVIALQQFNQLGSHDTIRFLTAVSGDKQRLKLAVGLLMTYVGVPCVYYGDEIGMEGETDPDNRRCMIWDEAAWDHELRRFYQKLIALRRVSPALQYGGFQMLYAQGDVIAYQRQSKEQRLIVVGYRSEQSLPHAAIPMRHAGLADGVKLVDLLSGEEQRIEKGRLLLNGAQAASLWVFEAR